MMHPSGISGPNYDRYLSRQDDSALAKIRQNYWTVKQALRSKLGKKEDDHLVASDAELDAKLAVFYSVKNSCENMLRCIEHYQDFICELSGEENALGRFLKTNGKEDKTQAGKMMSAVGRAQSFAAQQRLALRVPLVRLYQELDVFTERAVGDCLRTVEATEKARTEYRGSLLWMKNVSEQLDPDTYRQLEKFRKVQAAVKRNKAKFDKNKLDCLQKVDLLAASRCNLFSHLMANYQNCLLNFWDRTSKAHTTVSENFKGYQHFEFAILKDLTEPSKQLARLTSGELQKDPVENPPNETKSDEDLLGVGAVEQGVDAAAEVFSTPEQQRRKRNSMEELLFFDSPEHQPSSASAAAPSADIFQELQLTATSEGGGDPPLTSMNKQQPSGELPPKLKPPPAPLRPVGSDLGVGGMDPVASPKTDAQMWQEIMGGEATTTTTGADDSFTYQWQHAFGSTTAGAPSSSIVGNAGDINAAASSTGPGVANNGASVGPSAMSGGAAFLPSELMDLSGPMSPARRTSTDAQQKKNDWFSMFADLDPLKNDNCKDEL